MFIGFTLLPMKFNVPELIIFVFPPDVFPNVITNTLSVPSSAYVAPLAISNTPSTVAFCS